MYKKAMSCLLLANLLFLFGFLSLQQVEQIQRRTAPAFTIKLDERLLSDRESSTLGIVTVAASGQRIVDCDVLEKEMAYDLEPAEQEVLLRIVEAEAGCEDENGRLLVANVILNRMKNEKFPDTVSAVVFQKEKGVAQFSPIANGRYEQVEISEATKRAVGRALEGEDISQGALYFAARKYADSQKMQWFDENLTFLFQYGGHEFFR